MEFLFSISLLLTMMSYFSLTNQSFHREYVIQVHDFTTQHFYLGVFSEDLECEEQQVSCLTLGFIFFVVKLTTYKHTEGTLKANPFLRNQGMCFWQRLVYKFSYSLDLPFYKDWNEIE